MWIRFSLSLYLIKGTFLPQSVQPSSFFKSYCCCSGGPAIKRGPNCIGAKRGERKKKRETPESDRLLGEKKREQISDTPKKTGFSPPPKVKKKENSYLYGGRLDFFFLPGIFASAFLNWPVGQRNQKGNIKRKLAAIFFGTVALEYDFLRSFWNGYRCRAT